MFVLHTRACEKGLSKSLYLARQHILLCSAAELDQAVSSAHEAHDGAGSGP